MITQNTNENSTENSAKNNAEIKIECAYCHNEFTRVYDGQECCDVSCGSSYRKEQIRIACNRKTYSGI